VSVTAICAGKGSPGASFVAVNLSAVIAQHEDVLLLDLDPSGGDLGAYLGLDPRRGLLPLTRMAGATPTHQSLMDEAEERGRLRVVGGFQEACSVTTSPILAQTLQTARETDAFVVADIGRVRDDTPNIIAATDLVLLVVRPDLISVAGAERALRVLKQGGAQNIATVICGLERRRPGDVAEVGAALGVPVLGSIPLDRAHARAALVAQSPVAKGRIMHAMNELADAIRPMLQPVSHKAPEEVPA